MAITLDGTLGITSPAETVQGALTTTGNTILGDATTDTLNVGAGGLVKDASGNVGIGTASPGAKLGVAGDVRILANAGAISHTFIYNESGGEIKLHDETGADATLFDQSGNITRLLELINGSNLQLGLGSANTTGVVQFMGAGYTERMRIDSAGAVLVGTTSLLTTNEKLCILQTVAAGWGQSIQLNNTANGTLYTNTSGTASYTAISFRNNGATFSLCGNISVSGSTTTYATSSDYRLKENIAPMTGALTTVSQLKPVTYSWKVDGSDGQGFIAHELQAVVPDCVVGEKDAVDAEGNPVHQGIDTSFLVATLTAAIQELKAIVDAQAVRIAALES